MDDAKRIKWCLDWLTQHCGDELSVSELNLLISFEDQFKRKGTLSPKQIEVLESIYKKHS